MSDGYQVLMGDLLGMAQTFHAESSTISGAESAAGVSAPDGGGGTITVALANAVRAAGLATGQLGAVVSGHGDKLSSAEKKYQDAERSSAQLVQELTRLISAG
jgi:hypothetical protein